MLSILSSDHSQDCCVGDLGSLLQREEVLLEHVDRAHWSVDGAFTDALDSPHSIYFLQGDVHGYVVYIKLL